MRAILLIVKRSLATHLLSTVITVASVGLGCGLVISVFSLSAQTEKAFSGGNVGFDAVLGARGSALQLVLNAVFHLETSPGNIPWKLYSQLKADKRVELAIPYAVGDNFRGHRIVGTTEELFTKFEYQVGKRYQLSENNQRIFSPLMQEAVIGSRVASETGLGYGSKFSAYHGLVFDPSMKHDGDYTVVAVMKPTNTPADGVIFIPIEGVFRMPGHLLRGDGKQAFDASVADEIPDEFKEVSAVLLKFRGGRSGFQFDQMINKQGKVATLAYPVQKSMAELFIKLGWVHTVLRLVAYMVGLVLTGSILAIIYNTINERRREFAILRSLGARRRTVFCAIVCESFAIALLGSLIGFLFYFVILSVAASFVKIQTGVVLDLLFFHEIMFQVPLAMMLAGAIAGILPANKAYATDVATALGQ